MQENGIWTFGKSMGSSQTLGKARLRMLLSRGWTLNWSGIFPVYPRPKGMILVTSLRIPIQSSQPDPEGNLNDQIQPITPSQKPTVGLEDHLRDDKLTYFDFLAEKILGISRLSGRIRMSLAKSQDHLLHKLWGGTWRNYMICHRNFT